MSKWEKSKGDRSKFSFSLSFRPDPDDGKGATEEDSASWGAFQIWVNGSNLCAHQLADETHQEVHWYLLPLLEWFAANWEPLFHEERLPFNDDKTTNATSLLKKTEEAPPWMSDEDISVYESRHFEWRQRHALESCANGGLFPNLILRRWRELLEFSWEETEFPGIPEHFSFISSSGVARVSPELVAEPLYDVIQDAVSFLSTTIGQSQRLRQLKKVLSQIPKTPKETRIAWMAGLGRDWTEIDRHWQRIRELLSKKPKEALSAIITPVVESRVVLGSCEAGLMFGSVSPSITEQDTLALAVRLIELYDYRGDQSKLKPLAHEEPLAVDAERPWKQGYEFALEMLESFREMGIYDGGVVKVEEIVKSLGVSVDKIALEDRGIRAVAIASPKHRAGILLNQSHYGHNRVERERFTLAHELCHLLYDRAYGTHLAMASGPWAPVQLESRANAFAAMFLMPLPLVKDAILRLSNRRIDSADDVEQLALEMRTSFLATVEHLHNLGFIGTTELETIKEQRDQESTPVDRK